MPFNSAGSCFDEFVQQSNRPVFLKQPMSFCKAVSLLVEFSKQNAIEEGQSIEIYKAV